MYPLPYPWPGTYAAQALAYVQANPGCSQNAVGRALGCSDAGPIVRKLKRHGLININTNERGHHTIWPAA